MSIPRTISFFWTGPRMSWMRYMTLRSFRLLNPDWKMILYSTDTVSPKRWATHEQEDVGRYCGDDWGPFIDSLNITRKRWDEPIPNLAAAHMSGLCGWDTLANRSGFIADMDILFVKPMDVLYESCKDDDVVFFLTSGYSANGFMASAGDNQLTRDIYTEALRGYVPSSYQCVGPEVIYRMAGYGKTWGAIRNSGQLSLDCIRAQYPDVRIQSMSDVTVYPWNCLQIPQIFTSPQRAPDGCVGIHWFGGDPLSQKWNSVLTESNFREFDNTFTRYAKKLYGGCHE